jgi:outer membrane immunogenic protein
MHIYQEINMKLSAISKAIVVSIFIIGAGVANAKTHHARTDYKGEVVNIYPRPMLKDGFYLGAQAGYDAFRIRQSSSSTANTITMLGSVTGWTGGLFAGYGQYFQNLYYLAGEVLFNYNGNNQTVISYSDDDGDRFSQTIRVKETYGIAVLPGLRLQDTVLGYLRFGYDWTKFSSAFSSLDGNDGSTLNLNNNTTQGGWVAGIGMEALITCHWSVKTEYNHVWYQSKNLLNPPIGTANTNISDNQFNVGVVYHFA